MPLIKLLDGIYVMINDIEQRKVMHLKIIKARQIYLKYTNNISFIIWRNEDGNRSGNGDNNGGSSVEGGHWDIVGDCRNGREGSDSGDNASYDKVGGGRGN